MTMSLRMTAVRATLRGFPAATSCSNRAFAGRLCWIALRAGMKRERRTEDLPPCIRSRPCHRPDWRDIGARPAKAAVCLPSIPPSSGMSTRIAVAETIEMPGMLTRILSASAQVRVRVDDGLHGAVDRRDLPLDLRETLSEETAQKGRSGRLEPRLSRSAIPDEPAPEHQQIPELAQVSVQVRRRCGGDLTRQRSLAHQRGAIRPPPPRGTA